MGTGTRFLLAGIMALGCGCSPGVYRPEQSGSGGSGGGGLEAGSPTPDAQPDAAGPCTGGQAAATDPQSGHCYAFFDGVLTFDDADASCKALGIRWHLATLTSAREDTFVHTLVGLTETWIGLDNKADPLVFSWVTGEPVGYTNWVAGEPNAGADACARIKPAANDQWADQLCVSTYAYLCERD